MARGLLSILGESFNISREKQRQNRCRFGALIFRQGAAGKEHMLP